MAESNSDGIIDHAKFYEHSIGKLLKRHLVILKLNIQQAFYSCIK